MVTARQQRFAGLTVLASTRVILDVLVINAGDLIYDEGWTRTIQRIHHLAREIARTVPEHRSPWLLVMTHTQQEREQAYSLALVLSTTRECQGVVAVVERDSAAWSPSLPARSSLLNSQRRSARTPK